MILNMHKFENLCFKEYPIIHTSVTSLEQYSKNFISIIHHADLVEMHLLKNLITYPWLSVAISFLKEGLNN